MEFPSIFPCSALCPLNKRDLFSTLHIMMVLHLGFDNRACLVPSPLLKRFDHFRGIVGHLGGRARKYRLYSRL